MGSREVFRYHILLYSSSCPYGCQVINIFLIQNAEGGVNLNCLNSLAAERVIVKMLKLLWSSLSTELEMCLCHMLKNDM